MKEDKYKFQKLTLFSDVDMSVYNDALEYVFANNDIRNVAISGPYGAGKSSVLASYKEKNKSLRFLHISLAHYEQPNEKVEANIKEVTLEGKILNQLIHQIPAENIPQTNFKVKKKVAIKGILRTVILLYILCFSLLHLTLFNTWKSFVASLANSIIKTVLSLLSNPYSLIFSGLLFTVSLSVFIWLIIRAQMNKNIFRKISLQGNEIEIFEDDEDSYFDKYLNEVLYLFENAKADVIVFEDIDRFNVNKIFERLREISTLVNIQLSTENKPSLRFFYLLRDDIFISKDRTKFFDFIVPVVPVVDSSNSYDQFIAHFKEGGIFNLFDVSFLQGISLYVDDMRILKNIYNEFVIYYNRLNTTELDCNKMLAMITYKNIFPRDFSDLQLNRGMVYSLFEQKEKFIENEIMQLQTLIQKKKKEINLITTEHLVTLDELKAAYDIKQNKLHNYNSQAKQKELERLNVEQANRKQAIEDKHNNRLPIYNNELHDLELEVIKAQDKQLKEIITRDNIDSIFKITSINEIGVVTSFNDLKGSEYFSLLKYLIRNGFIDETYADYMTYFYENSLSRTDKAFLRSITDKKSKEPTYQLKNKSLIVDRLKLVDFDQEEVLNYDLLEYLLQTPTHSRYLHRFIMQLKDTLNYRFVGAYFDTMKEQPSLVKTLNSDWPELLSYALVHNTLLERQLHQYSILSIYYSSDYDIMQINKENCLTKYISEKSDYLNISQPNIEKLISGFILLDISFQNIELVNADKILFNKVYYESLYQLNFSNIKLMMNSFYTSFSEEDIRHKNYTLITTESESPLANYINQNISLYVNVLLDNCDEQITDEEYVFLLILNNRDVLIDQKISYINKYKYTISSLSDVDDKILWNILLDNRTTAYSVKNVMDYFEISSTLDNTLVEFINSEETTLNFNTIEDSYNEDSLKKIFDETIVCNKLSNTKYKEMIISLGFVYESFNIEGISDNKIRILIDTRIIAMNIEALKFIRIHYLPHTFYFIQKGINKYVDMMTTELFNLNELKEILTWEIDDTLKINLLSLTKEPLSIVGKNYTSSVIVHILMNNLYHTDPPALFSTYDNWVSDVKAMIVTLAINRLADIVADTSTISISLLKTLFESTELNSSQKIDLFIVSMTRLSEDECKNVLESFKLPEFKKLYEPRKRPSIEVNETNRKLLKVFSDENIINSFEEDINKPGYYKIIRLSPASKTLTNR